MKAVTYCRVSTDEQKENGTELKGQAERCREYATRLGFEIIAELEDAGISGKIPVAERPGGSELYRLVASRTVIAVIMTRSDRLSRDEYGVESGLFHRHCDSHNVTLHLVDEGGEVRSDMGGRLMLSLGDRMGGEERKKNVARMREGRLNRVRGGTLVLCGHTPYGYRKRVVVETDPITQTQRTNYYLEIDEQQADIVRGIFSKYTQDRWSIKAIARQLNQRQIPSPRGNKKPRPGKHKSEWYSGRVYDFLTNTKFVGEFVYANIKVPRSDLAIIDRETFERARKLLATNKQNSKRRTKYEYLWRSRLTCECGRKFQGKVVFDHGKYTYRYYRCNEEARETTTRCTYRKTINVRYFDNAAWAKLVEALDPELIKKSARDYVAKQANSLEPRKQRLSLAITERAEAEHAANEYVRLAGRRSVSQMLLAKYEHEAEMELTRVERLTHEIETIRDELSRVVRYDENEVDRVLSELNTRLANGIPTFDQKRKFIEWANVQGRLEGEDVKFRLEIGITFSVPRSNSSSVSHSNPGTGQA